MSVFEYGEFPFHVVELLPGGKIYDHIAVCKNFTAARAAFFAVLPERKGRDIVLKQGIRYILEAKEFGYSGIDPLSAPRRRP